MPNYYFLKITDVDLIEELFIYFLIVASIVFLLVVFFTFFFLFRYGVKKRPEKPSQIESTGRAESVLAIIVTIVIGVFVYLTIGTMKKVQTIPENPKPFLEITGHQWWWEAKYPNSGVVTANQIYIPTGQKILLKLTSADVIHSWWVPELGRKLDMIPGIDNYMWFYADKEGEYLGTCSEFCGVQHARMRIRVTALNSEAFEIWQQQQLQPVVTTSSDELFLKGKQLFETKTCTNCHAINGTDFKENIGPNLTHFASRKRFLADMKVNNKENLRAWLTNPQDVKPGVKMPNFILSESEIDALVAYINNLK